MSCRALTFERNFLSFKLPWYGHSLGDWDEELEEEAILAVQGEYLRNGEKIKSRRVKV